MIGPTARRELAMLDGRIGPAGETRIHLDPSVLHADGVFDFVRVYGGRPFALARHLQRLQRSAERARFRDAIDVGLLEREAAALIGARGGAEYDGALRIVLLYSGRRLLITEPLPAFRPCARLAVVEYRPSFVLDGVKSLSYAANMQADRLAGERGFDEALLATPEQRVLEGPFSSLFYVLDDDVVSTPPLEDQILASITRQIVMETVEVVERSVSVEELLTCATEAFLASSAREIQPVCAIENRQLTGPGPRTTFVRNAFRARLQTRFEV